MRILIADDHDLVRDMIGELLTREADCQVLAASTLDEVLDLMQVEDAFDLVLLDYSMPGMNELEGLTRVIEAGQGQPVALISGVASKAIAEKALAAGAAGFLPKTVKAKSMVHAVSFMASGEIYVPVSFMAAEEQGVEAVRRRNLTERELEVLSGLYAGRSNKEIGLQLDLREVTVKLHVKTLSRKLGARNRTHAAMIAKDIGLLL
ncbi:response regulator transcription factor [Mariluticola halotolerans]|uniref:response regulator transcription factor n=1 Tax=Mariluticola halotolerans TaxID=2909283 RepID=UPI0026E41C54|nr:response regulator transcription factor [Mariluticola halotolerans]UJQ93412.1 response regulator transcription factor [Mariluticola halotolerans]